jgi:hypothetical protein
MTDHEITVKEGPSRFIAIHQLHYFWYKSFLTKLVLQNHFGNNNSTMQLKVITSALSH